MKRIIPLLLLILLIPCFATPSESPQLSIEAYYTPVMGLTGSLLKAALHDLIDDHQKLSYTPEVWEALKVLDEDPATPENVILILC